ncbi:MAG: HWE histidine kinase domain-containing protein [Hyphomicrobium sp.]|jgi:two-component sensor histidine kinase
MAAFAQSVLDALTTTVAVLDQKGIIVAVNEAWQAFARCEGGHAKSYVGTNYLDTCECAAGPDADMAVEAATGIRAVIAGELSEFCFEYPCHSPNERRWFMLRVTRFDDKGETYAVVAHENITERKEAVERLHFLLGEVNHRAKNLLAVVQAVARQMARDATSQEFARQLDQRLQSLSASQNLIIRGDWQCVALRDLIHSQLGHLGDAIGTRVHIEGKPLMLRPAAAQGIGLALHELATNAMKYGSLSNDTGEVLIAWSILSCGAARRFRINWTECGGPPVKRPKVCGFGQTVIECMAGQFVRGEVKLCYPASGVRWVLEAPEQEVVSQLCSSTGGAKFRS